MPTQKGPRWDGMSCTVGLGTQKTTLWGEVRLPRGIVCALPRKSPWAKSLQQQRISGSCPHDPWSARKNPCTPACVHTLVAFWLVLFCPGHHTGTNNLQLNLT
ncbi:hypothetical protein RUM43_003088 [Polyplax serrata]|uniref:Uncharacterized protein n=1 Tax=Polyplax serrata TaxID=468196 RepID=A0AAN8S9B8_POLSC